MARLTWAALRGRGLEHVDPDPQRVSEPGGQLDPYLSRLAGVAWSQECRRALQLLGSRLHGLQFQLPSTDAYEGAPDTPTASGRFSCSLPPSPVRFTLRLPSPSMTWAAGPA